MQTDDWTIEEVQQACALVGEANIYLSQLKNLEEKRWLKKLKIIWDITTMICGYFSLT